MSLVDIENEDYRRDILVGLQADADFAMNNSFLKRYLASIGNPIANDRLAQQLHWLKDQGLVILTPIENNGVLVKLTAQGEDVALGHLTVPNISRPALL